ncbi:hypothetical protein BH24CHL6_BH24CHL6_12490 [soil metagenome]
MSKRVELQTEVDAPRLDVYPLLASAEGLRRWLDDAELDARVGGRVRIRMLDGVAVGQVLALDPPQHISFSWDWEGEPLGVTTVVALDAIDHGARTHVTLRHVGLPDSHQVELHRSLWEHWLGRFEAVARSLPAKVETTHP